MITIYRRLHRFAPGLLLPLLLAACSGVQASNAAQGDLATATPTTAATAAPAATPAPPADPQVAPTPDLSTMNVSLLTSNSPYGAWRAEGLLAFFGPEEIDYARLTLRWESEESYREWTAYEEWSASGLGDSFLSEFHWSADGRYLYFTHNGFADGCGDPFVTNLHRFDLQDGSLSEIPLTGLGLDVITISPGADRMAYRTPDGIVIYDLERDEATTLAYEWPPGRDYLVGWYAWSPDGSELAFTINENYCFTGDPGSSIRVIHLESGEARTLTEHDPRLLLVTGWHHPRALEVDQGGARYLYGIDSGTLRPIPFSIASAILEHYLNLLHWGGSDSSGYYTYDRAAELYGGSLETLVGMNPDVEPANRAALLRNACQVNGFQCLPLREVIEAQAVPAEGDALDIRITVRLTNAEGGLFVLGPCCGEEPTGEPQTEFVFTVRQFSDGVFKVLELPPYVP